MLTCRPRNNLRKDINRVLDFGDDDLISCQRIVHRQDNLPFNIFFDSYSYLTKYNSGTKRPQAWLESRKLSDRIRCLVYTVCSLRNKAPDRPKISKSLKLL